jgi:hypothetical protein
MNLSLSSLLGLGMLVLLPACGGPIAGSPADVPEPADLREPAGDMRIVGGDVDGGSVDALEADSEGDLHPGDLTFDGKLCASDEGCASSLDQLGPCRRWACVGGKCEQQDREDAVPCDDGNACTTDDACLAGECAGNPVECTEDEDPCTTVACQPDSGCSAVPLTGASCDDGNACTQSDLCLSGKCYGQAVPCDDDDGCTVDGCDPLAGCTHFPGTGQACTDGDACTSGDTCQEGLCVGTVVTCDDGNVCTKDLCDVAAGCVFPPLTGQPCDDDSVCTKDDHCVAGTCTGTFETCTDGNPCTQDVCDPVLGCQHPPADGAPCNDGNECTENDLCVEGACMGQSAGCDDGNQCTLDSCTFEGGCIHTQPPGFPCNDGNACTAGDKCYQGVCKPGKPVSCDDGDDCTADSCNPLTGCSNQPQSGTPCNDHDACTKDDVCSLGTCIGQPIICGDSNFCTEDTCDPATGCVFTPLDIPCDDDDPCTEGDYCGGGQCNPGKNPQCLAVDRVVLAGDSWSTGLIVPLKDALVARGYEEVTVSWELTSKPGSKVSDWVSNPSLMDGLYTSMSMEPKADILFFTLTGNDYLGVAKSGLGLMGGLEWFITMTLIQWDLATFVAMVKAKQPDIKIMMVGYDYLHFEMIEALGNGFPGFERVKFNLGLVDLCGRARQVAASVPDMIYAHNIGILQYTFGDTPHFPFPCPGVGFPAYGPGVVPKPGPAPGYDPFPGGWFTYPSPVEHIPDGIHPDYAGFRAIIENSLDQGAAAWIEGK